MQFFLLNMDDITENGREPAGNFVCLALVKKKGAQTVRL